MAFKVMLPKYGQTVEISEVIAWHVAEGAEVRKGATLCEIATDKSAMEVESLHQGILLRILLPPGKSAPVGCVMAIVGASGETLDDAFIQECLATQGTAPATARPAAAAPPALARDQPPRPGAGASEPLRGGRIFISPRARALAATHHVPVALIAGSGENGRIVEADVDAYLRACPAISPAARAAAFQHSIDLRGVSGSGADGRVMLADLDHANSTQGRAEAPSLVVRIEQPTPLRRAIAAAMTASAQTIPAFQLEVTVDASSLIARREAAQAAGHRIGYGDLIAKAVAQVIRRHPQFAATWTDAGIAYRDRINLGFAVAVPGGLVVPVIRDCDHLAVEDIAAQSAALVDQARAGKLAPADYAGAVFTLSNLGAFPIDRFVAIVPPGQSGILAIARIRDDVAVRVGAIVAAKLLSLTLSADHRIIDGADGAVFMRDVKEMLEG